jgi:hypothetical protein
MPRIFSLLMLLLVLAAATHAVRRSESTPLPLVQQCPSIKITCTTEVRAGVPVVVSAYLGGVDNKTPLIFDWTLSAGTIISGQGTSSVSVNTTALDGQVLVVTVRINGLAAGCPATASCSVKISEAQIRDPAIFDTYSGLNFDEEKPRLDNFAEQLRAQPNSVGFVIVSPSQHSRAGEAETLARRARKYLITERGIEASRIVIAKDQPQARIKTELQILPPNFAPAHYQIIAAGNEPASNSVKSSARPATPATRGKARRRVRAKH